MGRRYLHADTTSAVGEVATYLRTAVHTWRRGPAPPVVGIDGRSGAGKTTFGTELASTLGWPLLSTDDLAPGWDGLAESVERVTHWVLRPLADGRRARWQRFDWSGGREGDWVEVPGSQGLVVEGCGIGAEPSRSLLSTLIWLDVPYVLRRARLEARADWPSYRPHAAAWALQERALLRRSATAARADIVIGLPTATAGGRR